MNHIIKKITLVNIALFAFLLFFIAPHYSHAQEQGLGIGIEPALVEDNVDPGEEFYFNMRVYNRSNEEQTYYLTSRNIKELNAVGQPVFAKPGEETEYSVESWISFAQNSLTVGPESSGEVRVNINVPEDATPGGHFGSVFVSLQPPDAEGTVTKVGTNIGTLLNLSVAGEIVEDMIIRELYTDKTVYNRADTTFTVKVENKGNVLLRPHGPLEITNVLGQKVATLTMNETGRGIFPGQTREYEVKWQGDNFSFGRYQVLLGMVYGQEARQNVSSTVSFWVLPMNLILPVVGGLVALILGIYIFIKWRVGKKIKMIEEAFGSKFKTEGAEVDSRFSNKHSAPISRLALIALSLLFLVLVFLIILFLLFG